MYLLCKCVQEVRWDYMRKYNNEQQQQVFPSGYFSQVLQFVISDLVLHDDDLLTSSPFSGLV